MAVIIEGMEMPKGCRNCQLSHIINNDETYCNLTHHFVDQLVDRKDNDCPLRDVKTGHCKDCKYFEYDNIANVDGIKLIAAHEICKRWGNGNGCRTSENGYCFLFEPKEGE